jgi:hypothetical protein
MDDAAVPSCWLIAAQVFASVLLPTVSTSFWP